MAALAWHADAPVVYAGMGSRLAVVDVDDVATPRLVGMVALGRPATAVWVVSDGGAAGGGGVDGGAAGGGGARGGAGAGATGRSPLLLVGAGVAGVAVFDIAEPRAPRLLTWLDTDWFAFDLAYWRTGGDAGGASGGGARLLVADGGAGLALYDLDDPAAPRRLATLDTPSEARALAVDATAGRAYVADWGRGLAVVGLGSGDSLEALGELDTPGEAVDVAVDLAADPGPGDGGTWVFLADREGGLSLVDAADPRAPRLAGRWGVGELGRAEAVALAPGGLYLADGEGFVRRLARPAPDRLEPPGAAVELGGLPVGLALRPPAGSPAGSPGILAVANSRLGLQLLGLSSDDAAGAAPPALLGTLLSPSFVEGVAWEPGRRLAYLADAYAGLLVAELPAGRPPRVVGRLATGVATHDVALLGRRAFLADAGAGVRAVDIADPARPRDLGLADSPGEALGLALDGARGLAFLADGPGGMSVFDIREALAGTGAPRLLATLPAEGYAWSLRLDPAAGLVHVADRVAGLRTIDVREPASPRARGLFEQAGGLFELALGPGGRAYAGAGPGGLWLLDLSRPEAPRSLGRVGGGPAQGLALLDERLYVTAGAAGLRRYDLDAEGRPLPVAEWPLEGLTERIEGVLGRAGRILVACEWGGLAVLPPEDRLRDAVHLPQLGAGGLRP